MSDWYREDYEVRKTISIRELVDGYNRLGKRYQYLYVFADNITELMTAITGGAVLALTPVVTEGRFHFTFNNTGYFLIVQDGVARLEIDNNNNKDTTASYNYNNAALIKYISSNIAAATELKGSVWDPSLIIGLLRYTDDNPNRIFPLCFKDNNWVAYDGGLLKWIKTILGADTDAVADLENQAAVHKACNNASMHLPECNNWKGAIGDPGCICIVVNRNEYAQLQRRAEAATKPINFDEVLACTAGARDRLQEYYNKLKAQQQENQPLLQDLVNFVNKTKEGK
jgi:hypothetical protein